MPEPPPPPPPTVYHADPPEPEPIVIVEPPPYVPSQPYVHQVRNLTQFLNGWVDCEILHEIYGWVAFTANPEDTAPATIDVFNYIAANGIVIASLPPSPSIAANKITEERSWRDNQLLVADIAIEKLQDNDPSATFNLNKWRTYRIALRNWPQNPNFPNPAFRPVYPH